MIGVINYGLGNVQAILNIYNRLEMPAQAISSPSELDLADKLILPGVGAFDWAMSRLNDSGLLAGLSTRVLAEDIPVLGICVGMQMLATSSEEGSLPGLNWVPGRVKRLPATASNLPLPHMGWNSTTWADNLDLFVGFESGAEFYFLHSYYFEPDDEGFMLSSTEYGISFAASVRRKNVFGTQFHPEKSHAAGINLLRNFGNL
jgi:glutamine amidotransferase